jgi:1,4-alpha-glucan branching enzyme
VATAHPSERGALLLVLHAHLPYVREPGRVSLEADWLPEAVAAAYLPLLEVLERLADDGVPARLTLSVSPTLLAMLADPALRRQVGERLGAFQELAEREARRTQKDAGIGPVAGYHRDRLRHLVRLWEDRHRGDLVSAFVRLEQAGLVDLITTAATHAFLPLLRHHPEALRAQVALGVGHHAQAFGRRPGGFWLPECGYHPGIEAVLGREELRFTFLEARGVQLAEPRPLASVYAPLFTASGVAVYGRDPDASEEVWSAEAGYPSDPLYLDFHRDAGRELPLEALAPVLSPGDAPRGVGLRYHRVTGRAGEKAPYRPEAARTRAREHASLFVRRRLERLADLAPRLFRPPVVVAPYDAELFGHWWHEGPVFLETLLREAAVQGLATSTPAEDLARFPEAQLGAPAESSWGSEGSARTWLDPSNDWIPPEVNRATRALVAEASPGPAPTAARKRLLDQAARELLLAQSSDFPFILRAGTVADYARARVQTHLGRFWALLDEAAGRPADRSAASSALRADVLFPELDFRVFAPG